MKGQGHTYGEPCAVAPDGRTLATLSKTGAIELSDIETEKRVALLAGPKPFGSPRVFSMAFSPEGKFLASGSDDTTILLWDIVAARRLSAATMRNIRQNLLFAFIYNAAGVPIAAGVLYPAFGILLSPIIGAAAMALSSVSVIANALRLRKVRL